MMKDLPPEAAPVAERIELLGFGWRYFPEHKLADISRRVQVRDTDALAPSRDVARYTQFLRNGDKMPPVIFTGDDYLVDGATRTEAARRAKRDSFAAFVLDVKYEGSGDAMRKQLQMLGGSFNQTHGRGMSIANVERLIDEVTEDDDSARDIARKLHVSETTVTTVLNARKTRALAGKLGVELNGSFTQSHLKFFGGKIQKYTQPVWGEFVSLAQDARLSIPQVVELAKKLEAVGTEPERMEILAEARASYRPVINSGVRGAPSRASRVRQSAGYVLNQENPDLLVELDPSKSLEYTVLLDTMIEKYQKVRAAQMRLDFARMSEDNRRR